MDTIEVFFVLGPTGTGKSTFLNTIMAAMPDKVGIVEVGKKLRAMFPPDYFNGSAAPKHTQQLAMKICDDDILSCMVAGKTIILVDGQPRNPEQAQIILAKYLSGYQSAQTYNCRFLHLFTPTAVRKERLEKCYAENPGWLELAMKRLEGDLPALYEVLSMLSDYDPSRVLTFNTTNPKYDPVTALKSLLIFTKSPFEGTPTNAVDSSRG